MAGWAREPRRRHRRGGLRGAAPAVDALVEFAAEGPPDAVVERIETHDEGPEGLRGFTIG